MKKINFLVSILVLISFCTMAQPPKNDSISKHERFEKFKIELITKKLDLTTQEAQVFWPVFNSYEKEKLQIIGGRSHHHGIELVADKDVEALLNNQLDKEQKLINLKKAYLEKFKKVLPLRKIYVLYELENHHGKKGFHGKKHHFNEEENGPRPNFHEDFNPEQRN